MEDDIINNYIGHIRTLYVLSDNALRTMINKSIEENPELLNTIKNILFDLSPMYNKDRYPDQDMAEISICVDHDTLSVEELEKLMRCIRDIEQNKPERTIKVWMNIPDKTLAETEKIIDSCNPKIPYKKIYKFEDHEK